MMGRGKQGTKDLCFEVNVWELLPGCFEHFACFQAIHQHHLPMFFYYQIIFMVVFTTKSDCSFLAFLQVIQARSREGCF